MSRRRVALALLAAVTVALSVMYHRSRTARDAGDVALAGPREIEFLALDDGALPSGDAASNPAAECTTVLHLRVVGARGEPIAGARVACEFPATAATSAKSGAVELPLTFLARPGARIVRLRATAPGRANAAWSVEIGDVAVAELGDVVLGASGLVRGRVVGENGEPVAGAEVRVVAGLASDPLARFQGPREFVAAGASGGDGAFEIGGVPIGEARVWAGVSEHLWSASDVLAIDERAPAGPCDLVLHPIPPANVLDVTVVDSRGAPVPSARLAIRAGDSGEFALDVADASGRVRRTVEARTKHEVHAIDSRGELRAASAAALESGDGHHVLVLETPRQTVLEVREPSGAPIELFEAVLECASPFGSRRRLAVPRAQHSQGRVAVRVPDATFTLTVSAEGREPVALGPFEPGEIGATIEIEIAAPPRIRGFVAQRFGPAAGVEVTLHAADASGELRVDGCLARYAPEAAAGTITAGDGSFEFELERTGSFFVRASGAGAFGVDAGPFELGSPVVPPEVRLDLLGGSVQGHLLADPGEALGGREIVATRGDGFPQATKTDSEGVFRFELLASGAWWIGLREDVPAALGVTNVFVAAGATTNTLVLSERENIGVVRGRLAFDGEPAGGWTASLMAGAPFRRPVRSVTLAPDGTFELPSPMLGEIEVELRTPASVRAERVLSGKLRLDGAEQQLALDFVTGRIQGRSKRSIASPAGTLAWRAEIEGGWHALGRIDVGPDTIFVAPRVPAGPVSLVWIEGGGETALRELDLPARTTLDLDL